MDPETIEGWDDGLTLADLVQSSRDRNSSDGGWLRMRWATIARVFLAMFVLGPATFAADTRVTPDNQAGSYLRYDGTRDPLTTACSTGRRSQWEPSVAIDPTAPTTISIAANDSCTGAGDGSFRSWPSLHRSIDGGQSWHSALLPGYPGDTTPASFGSPVYGY